MHRVSHSDQIMSNQTLFSYHIIACYIIILLVRISVCHFWYVTKRNVLGPISSPYRSCICCSRVSWKHMKHMKHMKKFKMHLDCHQASKTSNLLRQFWREIVRLKIKALVRISEITDWWLWGKYCGYTIFFWMLNSLKLIT